MKIIIKLLGKIILVAAIATGCANTSKNGVAMAEPIEFDIKQTTFSYPGSAFSVGNTVRTKGLVLTDIRYSRFAQKNIIFRFLSVSDTDTIIPEATATPVELSMLNNDHVVGKACFESTKKFRLSGVDNQMILSLDSAILADNLLEIEKIDDDTYKLINNNLHGSSRHVLTGLNGSIEYNGQRGIFILSPGKNKRFEICVEETDSTWTVEGPSKSFEQCVTENIESFNTWLSGMPVLPEKYSEARSLAAYILWSCIIEGGNYERPGILMSKNWMHYIWSWDHCFNAMACSYGLPDYAWNNFITLFDDQNEKGQIPGRIGYSIIAYDYTKPPIHGWTLRKLMNEMELSDSQKERAYEDLKGWTNYWFNYKDSNNNGIPEFNHGYDSGWDNGTEFDLDGKTKQHSSWESPNLLAYLILQMDLLHDLAINLGYTDEAHQWEQKSDQTLAFLLTEHWDGEKFVTRNIEYNSVNEASQSLMSFLPVVLGEKLPEEIQNKLVDGLKNGGYLTEWGLATESINSPLYAKSGKVYWRGAIWAPSTMIIVDGLNKCGEHELAKEISRKYCDLCLNSGFAENFDALSGEGMRDLAYTWTASVFLVLGHELLELDKDQ